MHVTEIVCEANNLNHIGFVQEKIYREQLVRILPCLLSYSNGYN